MTASKRLLRLLATSVLALNLAACENSNEPTVQQADISLYQGQWLVINYWASWCKPCIEEIPELNHFAQTHNKNTKVFAVNFDGIQGQELKQQAAKIGIEFILLEQDPAPVLKHPIPSVLPTTYIYTPNGKLHKTLHGPQTTNSLEQALLP